jgi:predicted lipid-binding transport protein (Tim44 family)
LFNSFLTGGFMKVWSVVLVAALVLFSAQADAAKRLGGGKSVGKQSSNVTQSQAAPAAAPGGAAAAAKPAAPATPAAAAAPAAAPKKPWGAMLGGLAAGAGLAYLLSSMGMGGLAGMAGGIMQILMFAGLAFAAWMAFKWFMNRKNGNSQQGQQNSPFAMQGAGAGAGNAAGYNPANVGNDASARPWERNSMAFDATPAAPAATGVTSGGSMIGSALGAGAATSAGLSGSQSWGVPADFDTNGFLASAKQNFITLQAAWDKSDISSLRAMMTDDMLLEIKSQLAERESHTGSGVNHTDVAMLEAKLLGIEDTGSTWMASVEFSGMIKEDPATSAEPFREVWNMTRAKTGGGGWLVAGVQALT